MKLKFFNDPLMTLNMGMMEGDNGGGQGGGQPAGGEGGDGKQQTFVEKVDPVTGKTVKIPAEIESVIGHFVSKTRSEVEAKFKPILEQFENEKTDIETMRSEYEKLKEASMTAEERAQENARKKIQEHERTAKEKSEEATKWKGMFEKSTIRNDIFGAFGDAKLCNPGQVATLFQMEGNAFISEVVDNDGKPTGNFETRVRMVLEDDKGNPEEIEGTPAELFKKWISLERNSHHLVNTVSPGSGSRAGGNRLGGYNHDQLLKMSPTERMKAGREQAKGR